MKKLIISAVIFFIPIIAVLLTAPVAADPVPGDHSVWITTGNNNYHTEHCRLIKVGFKTKEIPIQKAIKAKYTPHRKCRPPSEVSKTIPPEKLNKPKKKIIGAAGDSNWSLGQSAKDIPRDPDGTAIGNAGSASFNNTPSSHPKRMRQNQSEATFDYKTLNFEVKKLHKDSIGNQWVSAKLLIRNYNKIDATIYSTISGLDKDGFEIISWPVAGRIAANATDTITDRYFIPISTYNKVKRWEVK